MEEPDNLVHQYGRGVNTPDRAVTRDAQPFTATNGTPPGTPPRTPPQTPPQDQGSKKDVAQISANLQQVMETSGDSKQSYILSLSARDENSLRATAFALADSLVSPNPAWTLPDLAYTLNDGRTHFPWRLAVQSSSLPELRETLVNQLPKPSNSPQKPKLGFVFTGQGAQWFAMGRELISVYPTFQEALEEGGKYMRLMGANWDPIGM